MAKLIKCPSCGASDSVKMEDDHYVCNYCESQFKIEEKRGKTDILDAMRQMNRGAGPRTVTVVNPKTIRTIMFSIVLLVLGIGLSIFFFVNSTINDAMDKANEGVIKGDDYWSPGTINKFYVFEGKHGPSCWMLINQSSKKLDSAKYTLQIVNPKNLREKTEMEFITMTWNESFNFGNYLSEMACYNNKVYFLSDAKGLNVHDLYSGKLKTSNDEFAKKYKELNSGIVSAKYLSYRNAIELMTNDGFKFYFLPQHELLVSEENFNDYQKIQGYVGGFSLVGESRQEMFYFISKQDTLRNDFSFSDHYMNEYLNKAKNAYSKEKAFKVDESKVFFNGNFVFRNPQFCVFTHSQNVAKDSKAFLTCYRKNDFTKPAWQIELSKIKGFEDAVKENFYLRTSYANDELAIWYEAASKTAFGVNVKTGKTNWTYSQ